MSATPIDLSGERAARFYHSTAGQKAVMAISGVALLLFVIAHLVGNLQFFEGPDKMRAYGRLLRTEPALLWTARVGLLLMAVLHIWSSILLALRKRQARPIRYIRRTPVASSYASRTMYWSGPIIAAFVVYHLLDLTFGAVNPNFQEGEIYANMIHSFQNPLVSGFYILAMALLCLHLYHGAWSMFQTLGMGSPRYTPLLKRSAAILSLLLFAGFASIPLSVLTGWKS